MRKSDSFRFIIPIHSTGDIEFLAQVGDSLQDKGHSIRYIPQDEFVKRSATGTIRKENIGIQYLDHTPKNSFDYLCDKYNIYSPKKIVFPQMVYDRKYDSPSYHHHWLSGSIASNYEQYLEILHRTLDYLDQVYEEQRGGIPIQGQGAEILRRSLQRVADYHGYQSVRRSFSPVPGKSIFRGNESMIFSLIENLSYDEMNSGQRQAACDLRDSITKNKQNTYTNSKEKQSESIWENIGRKIDWIKDYKYRIGPFILDWLRQKARLHRRIKPIKGAIAKRIYMNKKKSENFIQSNKYIFYPIQFFRESRVTMRAPAFYNQLWLIEYLSRSVPEGYELVVKDHPRQVGSLPISQTRYMNRYAKVIAPTIPARRVIDHSDAVITLNNTVGFESIMFGKPVIALGDGFYTGFGYTQDISDLHTLPKKIDEAVSSNGLSEKEVIEFSHIILKISYEGEWRNTTDENIEKFSDSICDFVETHR